MDSANADTAIKTAISVPASPPPRDSMEDADPSLTRKRPRLDSGGAETPVMHADTDTESEPTAVLLEQQVEMTIRSQPPSTSHTRDAAAGADDAHATAASNEAAHIPAAIDGTSSGANDADGANDSASDSPPVIAIDDDDDDDDADLMARYATAASLRVDFDPDAYLSRFPFAHNGDYLYAAQEIAKYIHTSESGSIAASLGKGHADTLLDPQVDGAIIDRLSDWIDGLPDEPLEWLSFYVNQAGLWDEICTVALRLLHRK